LATIFGVAMHLGDTATHKVGGSRTVSSRTKDRWWLF
jgi:hypothetical protein